MTGFSDKLVAKLREINDVKLADNPIVCDICHMGALVEIARTVSFTLANIDDSYHHSDLWMKC